MKLTLTLLLLVSTTIIQLVRTDNMEFEELSKPNLETDTTNAWNWVSDVGHNAYEGTANQLQNLKDSVEDAASTLYEYGSSATTELKNIVSTSASETSESIQTTVDDVVYNE